MPLTDWAGTLSWEGSVFELPQPMARDFEIGAAVESVNGEAQVNGCESVGECRDEKT